MPVVYARFDLVTPAKAGARYRVQGASLQPTVLPGEGGETLRWEVKEQPALVIEPFGPAWQDQVIAVRTAPTTFEIEGVSGGMGSWQGFGQWYDALNAGRATLPPEAKGEVHRLTSHLTDLREKVRRLYTYMQGRTRYVSIQLGLGGWQTFDAAYVHERGYGDCKALTNYMRALLSEAGIASFPALIEAGTGAPGILPDFPSNQFNHVILYVEPGDGEGIWLENTDQTTPFGHLGTFTEGRYALLVGPGGGQLVRTPTTPAQENQKVLNARVHLDPSGNATAQIAMRFSGNQLDEIRLRALASPGREWLLDYLDVPTFDIVTSDASAIEAREPAGGLSMTLALPHYAPATGTRRFVPLNLLHRWTFTPPATEERTQPVEYFRYAFLDVDTVRYELPEGFDIEALPDPVEFDTGFLRYAARAEVLSDGALAYYRAVEVTEPTLPKEQYDALREAVRRIVQADRAQVVLIARKGD
jgi:hypothetical protein